MKPYFSIITPTKNSEKTIRRTIESVLSQTFTSIEYLIIDGLSTDKTLEIISCYKDKRLKIVSENDSGVSEAFNKGIRKSCGEIIGIINSDDYYFDREVLEKVNNYFSTSFDLVYGNALFKEKNDVNWVWNCSSKLFEEQICKKMCIPHPAVFVRRSVYESVGNFDNRLKVAMDYDFILRTKHQDFKIAHLNELLAVMTAGGISDQRIIKKNIEVELVRLLNGVASLFDSFISLISNIILDFASLARRKI
jgi:glycosyltransferase involved in cell wall biosynthesis